MSSKRTRLNNVHRKKMNKLTQQDFENKAKEKHGGLYDLSKAKYTTYRNRIDVICNRCSNEFHPVAGEFLRGTGCPTCSHKNRKGATFKLTTKTFIEKARKVHGDKYDYSLGEYKGSKIKYPIRCNACQYIFYQEPRRHISGRGCQQCANKNKVKSLTQKQFIEAAKAVHGDKYDYSEVEYGKNNREKIKIICPVKGHGVFWQMPRGHLEGKGCMRCAESIGETNLATLLDSYGIKYLQEYKLPDSNYRYDFYLIDFNILIEFDGIQHIKPINHFGGMKHFIETKRRDKEKNKLARLNNIPLIRIPYNKMRTMDQVLISKLTSVYKYWLVINDKIVVHKNFLDLCKAYNLPKDTKVGEELEALKQKIVYKLLF